MIAVASSDIHVGYIDLHAPGRILSRAALGDAYSSSELMSAVYLSGTSTGKPEELPAQVTHSRPTQISIISSMKDVLNREIGLSERTIRSMGSNMVRNISRNTDNILPKGRLVSLRGMGKRLVSEEELENAIERAKRSVFSGVGDEILRN